MWSLVTRTSQSSYWAADLLQVWSKHAAPPGGAAPDLINRVNLPWQQTNRGLHGNQEERLHVWRSGLVFWIHILSVFSILNWLWWAAILSFWHNFPSATVLAHMSAQPITNELPGTLIGIFISAIEMLVFKWILILIQSSEKLEEYKLIKSKKYLSNLNDLTWFFRFQCDGRGSRLHIKFSFIQL